MTDTLTPEAKLNILGREWDRRGAVVAAARALLERIDNMTTSDFERGGERTEREALRQALGAAE